MPHDPRKLGFVDALRGWAFLGVLTCHLAIAVDGLPAELKTPLTHGDKGVQLFFLASALTLFRSQDARRGGERRPILNFLLRRYFRIAPLFYAGLLFYLVAFPGHRFDSRTTGAATPGAILSTVVFLHGWGPYWINTAVPGGWSIAVEMTFYAFVPLLYSRVKSMSTILILTLAMHLLGTAITLGARWALARSGVGVGDLDVFCQSWLFAQTTAFGAGVALYFLTRDRLRDPDSGSFRHSAGRSAWLLVAAAYLFIVVACSDVRLFAQLPLFDASLLLFAWALALHPFTLFVNRVTRWVGVHSFSAYLTHFAALEWALRVVPTSWSWQARLPALAASTLGLTIALSTATHRLIEVPGQALGRRLIARLEGSRPAGAADAKMAETADRSPCSAGEMSREPKAPSI